VAVIIAGDATPPPRSTSTAADRIMPTCRCGVSGTEQVEAERNELLVELPLTSSFRSLANPWSARCLAYNMTSG